MYLVCTERHEQVADRGNLNCEKMRFLLLSAFLLLGLHFQGLLAQIPEGEIAITASSTLPASSTASFTPENLMDGTPASWSEGAEGNGTGEAFFFDFRYPDDMRYVVLKNGYGVEKYWEANARIKTLVVSDAEGESRRLCLEDTPQLRAYGLTTLVEDEYGILQRGKPLSGNHFEFRITDVYEGKRWEDACMAEVMVNHWFTNDFPMDTGYINMHLFRICFDGVIDGSGQLYMESDWEGYVPVDVEDGYFYEEIVSGDGTTGYREYNTYLNEKDHEYYLFSGELLIFPDQMTQEGKVRGDPVMIKDFTAGFFRYDKESDKLEMVDPLEIFGLFGTSPLERIAAMTGKSVGPDALQVRPGPGNQVRFIYPVEGAPEAELKYFWSGEQFINPDSAPQEDLNF